MKINYTAINEKLTVDDVIAKLISENAKEKGTGKLDAAHVAEASANGTAVEEKTEDAPEVKAEQEEKGKKKLFGRK